MIRYRVVMLTEALKLLLDGSVFAFGVPDESLHQAFLRDHLAGEGLANRKDRGLSWSGRPPGRSRTRFGRAIGIDFRHHVTPKGGKRWSS